jgi:hypothetical protein
MKYAQKVSYSQELGKNQRNLLYRVRCDTLSD